MGHVKTVIRSLARPLLACSNLDLRVARLRLQEFGALNSELSAAFTIEDSPGQPNSRLLELSVALISRARTLDLGVLEKRGAPSFVHLWPGEHYRLLHAIVQETKPELVLEIGTYTGLSALTMLSAPPQSGRLVTFDIIPWDRIPGTFLRRADFSTGRLQQVICDLGTREGALAHAGLLRNADLILVDASKDGVFERKLLGQFNTIGLKRGALVVFDDIRFWNMVGIWRQIHQPKLDLTGFGHWSGTGLVDWQS